MPQPRPPLNQQDIEEIEKARRAYLKAKPELCKQFLEIDAPRLLDHIQYLQGELNRIARIAREATE